MKSLITGLLFLITYVSSSIDTQQLQKQIQYDLHNVYVKEMGLLSITTEGISQGNADLKKDLDELYDAIIGDTESATQKILDRFCKKWGLEALTTCCWKKGA